MLSVINWAKTSWVDLQGDKNKELKQGLSEPMQRKCGVAAAEQPVGRRVLQVLCR